jgi:hypothetical protein
VDKLVDIGEFNVNKAKDPNKADGYAGAWKGFVETFTKPFDVKKPPSDVKNQTARHTEMLDNERVRQANEGAGNQIVLPADSPLNPANRTAPGASGTPPAGGGLRSSLPPSAFDSFNPPVSWPQSSYAPPWTNNLPPPASQPFDPMSFRLPDDAVNKTASSADNTASPSQPSGGRFDARNPDDLAKLPEELRGMDPDALNQIFNGGQPYVRDLDITSQSPYDIISQSPYADSIVNMAGAGRKPVDAPVLREDFRLDGRAASNQLAATNPGSAGWNQAVSAMREAIDRPGAPTNGNGFNIRVGTQADAQKLIDQVIQSPSSPRPLVPSVTHPSNYFSLDKYTELPGALSRQDLQELTGLDPEKLNGMSWSDLQNAIEPLDGLNHAAYTERINNPSASLSEFKKTFGGTAAEMSPVKPHSYELHPVQKEPVSNADSQAEMKVGNDLPHYKVYLNNGAQHIHIFFGNPPQY